MAPAGTPREIIAKLNAEVQKLLAIPEVREKLEKDGVDLTPSGPERMQAFVGADMAAWKKLIAEGKLVLE